MKKFKFITLFLCVTFLSVFCFSAITACNNKNDYPVFSKDTVNEKLIASKYKDYAEEVKLDYENYPEIKDQGLFWTKWDSVNNKIIYVKADTEEGAALVNPLNPTIINVHGIKVNESHIGRDPYEIKTNVAVGSDFGYNTEKVNTLRIWLEKGFNVAVFSWEKFADDGIMQIEQKVWSKGGTYKSQITNKQSSYELDFSISELFAAEYIRAVKLLPKTYGDNEIRFAGHSMGGVVLTASMFLLTELVGDAQIKYKQIPKRLTYLDSYFGGTPGLSPTKFTISWSGKGSINNDSSDTFFACFNEFEKRGLTMEIYRANDSFVDGSMKINSALKSSVVQTLLIDIGEYSNNPIAAHPIIRDWYMCSILFDTPKDVSSTSTEGAKSCSASSTIEELKLLKGVAFVYHKGMNTIKSNDDEYVRVTGQGVI